MLDWIHELVGDAPWLPAALWVITIIVGLGFVIRWVGRAWPKLRRFVATMDSLAQLPEFIVRTDDSVAKMQQQILNNHGDVNMRDELTAALKSTVRTEQSVNGLHGRLDAVEREIGTLTQSDATIQAHIKEIEKTIPRDELGRFTTKEKS